MSAAVTRSLTVGDRSYPIDALLRSSAGSEVFHGRTALAGDASRQVVLKRLLAPSDEAAVLEELDHPDIVRLLDRGRDTDGHEVLVLEHAPGAELDRALADADLQTRLRWFERLCRATHHVHQRGYLHRDLAPDNVLVDVGKGTLRLIDFGEAREPAATQDDEPGRFAGTPRFTSPEQARGDVDRVDVRTDIHALGAILDELVAGAPRRNLPNDPLAAFALVGRGEPPLPPSRRSSAPRGPIHHAPRVLVRDLDAVVLTACAPEPADRYPSAEALAEEVARLIRDEPVTARPLGSLERLRRGLRRHAAGVIAAALVLAALTAGVVSTAAAWNDAQELALRATDARHSAERAAATLEERITAFRRLSAGPWLERAEFEFAKLLPITDDQGELTVREWRDEVVAELAARFDELEAALELTSGAADSHAAGAPDPNAQTRWQDLVDWLQQEQIVDLFGNEWTGVAASFAARQRDLAMEPASLPQISDEALAFLDQSLRDARIEFERALHPAWGLAARSEVALARYRRARTARSRDIEAWRAAVARVAQDPRFEGVRLLPRLGLVPLGPDPESGLEEFHHLDSSFGALRSGVEPALARDDDGRIAVEPGHGIVLVLVPGGTARIGCQNTDPSAPHFDPLTNPELEGPVHEVRLDPFLIAKHELTRAQWSCLRWPLVPDPELIRLMLRSEERWTHPVSGPTLQDAIGVLDRFGLEPPTEVQWEYAARAGSTAPWGTVDSVAELDRIANLADRSLAPAAAGLGAYDADLDDGYPLSAPIGSFAPNAFGLHDTLGNVIEWCRDARVPYTVPAREGDGLRRSGLSPGQAVRGGSFSALPIRARVAYRSANPLSASDESIGFRLTMGLDAMRER